MTFNHMCDGIQRLKNVTLNKQLQAAVTGAFYVCELVTNKEQLWLHSSRGSKRLYNSGDTVYITPVQLYTCLMNHIKMASS